MSAEGFLGPLEVGVVLSSIIFGVTCFQCYLYFVDHSTNDSVALKSLVTFLMILETLHTAFICHMLYFYTIKSFGDAEKFAVVLWSFLLQRTVSSLLSTITQCFLAIRVYHLNGRRPRIPVIIVTISMSISIATIGSAIIAFYMPKPFTNEQNVLFSRLGSLGTFFILICDMIITTSIIHHLQHSRAQATGTERAISMIIRYTLNTGLLTTIFALMTSIVFFVQQEVFTYTPFDFVLSRLYVCSLISILNSRTAVQKEFAPLRRRDTGTNNDIFTSVGFELSVIATTNAYA